MNIAIDLEAAKRVRDNGRFAIKKIDFGHRSEAAFLDVLAYAKQLESANARHVLNHIENICEICGHTKTEDGCAFCITEQRRSMPKIVCICGSSRFVQECAVKAWELNKQGIATFFMPTLPAWYPGVQKHHQAEAENVASNLDNLWLKLIELSDEVFVANVPIPGHENGYIGERTKIEIEYAQKMGKPINYLTAPA